MKISQNIFPDFGTKYYFFLIKLTWEIKKLIFEGKNSWVSIIEYCMGYEKYILSLASSYLNKILGSVLFLKCYHEFSGHWVSKNQCFN